MVIIYDVCYVCIISVLVLMAPSVEGVQSRLLHSGC